MVVLNRVACWAWHGLVNVLFMCAGSLQVFTYVNSVDMVSLWCFYTDIVNELFTDSSYEVQLGADFGALILGEFGPVLCEVRSKSRVRDTTPE